MEDTKNTFATIKDFPGDQMMFKVENDTEEENIHINKKQRCLESAKWSNNVEDRPDSSHHQRKLEETKLLREHLYPLSEETIKKDKGECILGTSSSLQRSSTKISPNFQGKKTSHVYGKPAPESMLPLIRQKSLTKIHDRLNQNEKIIKIYKQRLMASAQFWTIYWNFYIQTSSPI